MKHIHCLSKDCLPRIVDIAEKKKNSLAIANDHKKVCLKKSL